MKNVECRIMNDEFLRWRCRSSRWRSDRDRLQPVALLLKLSDGDRETAAGGHPEFQDALGGHFLLVDGVGLRIVF